MNADWSYRDASGAPRAELTAMWAVTALEQLRAAGVTPAMLESAVAQLVPVARAQARHEGEADRVALRAALQDQPRPVRTWLGALVDRVESRADLEPMLQHVAQVLSLLALATVTPRA